MNVMEGFALALAEKQAPKTGRRVVLTFWIVCPICLKRWVWECCDVLDSLNDVRGRVGEPFAGKKFPGRQYIRIDTSGWGTQALCGEDMARYIARINIGARNAVSAWTPEDERMMYGHLKHQQETYHAVATMSDATGEEKLVDEQRDRRVAILGNINNTLVSAERLEKMGVGWAWRT